MKGVGILVFLLRGVSFRFWYHLGCSGENAIVCSPYVAVSRLGFHTKKYKNIYLVF